MLAAQIPIKFQIPFANNAGGSFINQIPQGSQIGIVAGAASLVDGFPPVTFLPVGAGGTPPWGRDFNGLFNQITAWTRWQGAGGQTVFDATFSAAIGGYPQGALLQATTPGNMWVSIQDNNNTNPDTTPGAPGWLGIAFITSVQNGAYVSADDTGSADFYVAAPLPAPLAYVKYQRFQVKITNANLTTTPTLNIRGVSGLLGAKSIVLQDGSAVRKGQLAVGMVAGFVYDGTKFQLESGVGGAGGGLINIQVFLASGTYVPTVGTTKALVFATGGGGAGGNILSCGPGGGAGATAIALVNITGNVSVTIGAGGVGTGGQGGDGGTTLFGGFAVAQGGHGGPATNKGGLGGAATVGTMLIKGGDGGTINSTVSVMGGFGAETGGASFWGGGGAGDAVGGTGSPGEAYGSGGGGGDSGGVGGAGAPGVVFVMEF